MFNEVPIHFLEDLSSEIQEDSINPRKHYLSKKQADQIKVTPPSSNKEWVSYDLATFMLKNFPDAHGPTPYAGGGQIWTLMDCFFRPGDGRTMFILQLANGAISAGCQHDTCPGSHTTGNHWHEVREHFEGSHPKSIRFADSNLDRELAELPRTEYGLSERFRRRFGNITRYIETWGGKWIIYNGKCWVLSDCAAELYAQETIQAIRREAWFLKENDDDSDQEKAEESEPGPSPVGDGMSESSSDTKSVETSEQPPAA